MYIVTKTALPGAKLEVDITLEDEPGIVLTYTCPRCDGYGSPCQACTHGCVREAHTAQSLRERIGNANYAALAARLAVVLPMSAAQAMAPSVACEHGTPECPGKGDKHACVHEEE